MFVIFGLWEMNFFKEVSTLFVIDVALLITSWHRCYVRVMKFYMEGFIGLLCLDYVGSPLYFGFQCCLGGFAILWLFHLCY